MLERSDGRGNQRTDRPPFGLVHQSGLSSRGISSIDPLALSPPIDEAYAGAGTRLQVTSRWLRGMPIPLACEARSIAGGAR